MQLSLSNFHFVTVTVNSKILEHKNIFYKCTVLSLYNTPRYNYNMDLDTAVILWLLNVLPCNFTKEL